MTIKTTGHLKFAYNTYFTVDDKDLPCPDEYSDGDRGFSVYEICCDAMDSFNDGWRRSVKITTYATFEITPRTNKRKLVLEIDVDDGSSSIEVLSCPWCHTIPEFTLNNTIKRIKTCSEKVVTEVKKECKIKEQVVG